jgi:bacteriocin biosynthesis cyclodehydratase domain-containing protein
MALPFLPAIVLDNALHIGPTYLPHTQGCWQCYWRRRQAARGVHADDEHGTLLLPVGDEHLAELRPPAIAVAANLLAFEFFKQGTGVHNATLENEVYILELERMQNVKHHLFPHPLCTICAPYVSPHREKDGEQLADKANKDVAQLQQRANTLIPQKMLKHMDQWIDETCGIFTKIDERDLFQLPLIRSKVTIASPQKTDEGLPEKEAAGLDYVATHVQAMQEATTFYLDRIAVPRHAYYLSNKDREMHRNMPPLHNFSGWTGEIVPDQQQLPHQWGRWLDRDCPVLVPMAAVYPHTFWNQYHGKPLFDADTPGTVVGASWFETLARGMQTLITVLDKGEKDIFLPPRHIHARIIAKYAYCDDSICASYLKMLAILDHHIELADISSVSGVPRIGALLDGHCISIKRHWDAMVAVRESLQSALLHLQIERASDLHHGDQRERNRQQTPDCDAELLVDEQEATVLPLSLATETQYQKAVQGLQKRFQDNRWRLIIVPMVKDSTIDEVLGCTMRLLAVQ